MIEKRNADMRAGVRKFYVVIVMVIVIMIPGVSVLAFAVEPCTQWSCDLWPGTQIIS